MKFRPVLQIAGIINAMIALAMLAPLGVSLYYAEGDAWLFVYSIVISGVSGALMFFIFGGKGFEISHREGFVIVAFSWLAASASSSLPFILSGYFPTFTDAVFEAVSGITTTGASILDNVEDLPHGLLFWRSFMHWIGGVGIVLFSLAILPLLGVGGMQLYKAEASVVSADKFTSRVREMARVILAVYLVFSVTLVIILSFLGMNLFDSFIHMFGTVGTAGFSSKGSSIAHFDSIYIESVIVLFMILGATNFALHYRFFREGFKVYTKNPEFRFYILLMVVASILVAVNLRSFGYGSTFESVRHSVFQVVSVVTTTGFSTADFAAWPAFGQVLLLILMFTGGCAGSTTGAIKGIRLLLLLKLGYKEIYRLIHPHAVIPIKLSGRLVPPDVMRSVVGFTVLYFMVFVVSSLALSWMGIDLTTAVSSAAATISNVGPALGLSGPMASYSVMPEPAKWLLITNMLLGRLEIYTLLILFVPAFWRV